MLLYFYQFSFYDDNHLMMIIQKKKIFKIDKYIFDHINLEQILTNRGLHTHTQAHFRWFSAIALYTFNSS